MWMMGSTGGGTWVQADFVNTARRSCVGIGCELAKLSTSFRGVGIRVAQLGVGAQATCWWAVALHEAVMPNICDAFHRRLLV